MHNNYQEEQNQEMDNQYQNQEMVNQYQNQEMPNQYQNQEMANQYQNQEVQNQYQNDSEPEDENIGFGGVPMQAKFKEMKMENGQMFDDYSKQNQMQMNQEAQQMDPIEEGYSSDESFGAQQRQKYFKENFEFIQDVS
jgi:hypothetical protein